MNETRFFSAERRRRAAAGAVLALCGVAAQAQPEVDNPLFNGTWRAKVEAGLPAGYTSARVTMTDFSGIWQDTTPARHVSAKGCAGKKFPITVQRTISTTLEFMVWGSSISPNCPDLRVLLVPEGEKTLKGTLGETAVVLTKVAEKKQR